MILSTLVSQDEDEEGGFESFRAGEVGNEKPCF